MAEVNLWEIWQKFFLLRIVGARSWCLLDRRASVTFVAEHLGDISPTARQVLGSL